MMKSVNWFDHLLNFVAVILGVSLAFYISTRAEKSREKEELLRAVSGGIA